MRLRHAFAMTAAAGCALLSFLAGFVAAPAAAQPTAARPGGQPGAPACGAIVRADIVALEQSYLLNRFGAFVPAGMMFALRHDVVSLDDDGELKPGRVRLRREKRPRPLVLRVNEGECLEVSFQNLLRPGWQEEGGVLPDDGGSLPGHTGSHPGEAPRQPRLRPGPVSLDAPRTRAASFHVTGLGLVPIAERDCPRGVLCGGDGSNVGIPGRQGVVFHPDTPAAVRQGYDLGSLARPGQRVVTRWRAEKEGAYFAYSTAAPVGGEGDGGQIGLGLFASVNVEPAGARWYRSQVTEEEMRVARQPVEAGRHDYAAIAYDGTHPFRLMPDGSPLPLLAMRDAQNRIAHGDLNAIIVLPRGAPGCDHVTSDCGRPFREFTVIMHDEVPARQAFAPLDDENHPLSKIRDGMGINYGASGMGSLVMATPAQANRPPLRNCPECRAEEFFLSSWAAGDPALILAHDGDTPSGVRWSDDPSNVHHSYLGDAVRFRNLHAGPKETHVFHLHAHQWVMDPQDPDASYLDSQTISPGATFSYSIGFGGTGNRNYTPGDSIFHCHLYPHFAQGMWELWRVHDSFEDGKRGPTWYRPAEPAGPGNDPRWRNLPDAEIAAGTATPALVPIPGAALAPLPGAAFAGYPHYILGETGHRPPQPALDMDVLAESGWTDPTTEPPAEAVVNGGLPRHRVRSGSLVRATENDEVMENALARGGDAAQVIAQRVRRQADPAGFAALAYEWGALDLAFVPQAGDAAERRAMEFHEGTLQAPGLRPVANGKAPVPHPEWWPAPGAYVTDRAPTLPGQAPPIGSPGTGGEALFFVNGRPRAPGAPFANPCPTDAPMRHYRAAFIQTELTYNRHGWFDPQGRIIALEDDIHHIIDPATRTRLPEPLFFRANSGECITFRSTNLVPSALNVDDFQIITPTDTLGQHIHLVKFDVTSSDGSGNGWNYEDGTFSPEEVRERVLHYNEGLPAGATPLQLREHPLFRPGGTIWEAAGGDEKHAIHGGLLKRGKCDTRKEKESLPAYIKRLNENHPFCGAQRTTQRWWADPILSRRPDRRDRDNTLRTVFTHDHFGPSSHQQHGLYAGLVVEPANSLWVRTGERPMTPEEAATLAGTQPLDLAAQAACRDRAERMAMGEPDPAAADPATRARCKLLGGSDLTVPTAAAIRRDRDHPLAAIEPRPALRLRADGGPTATMADIVAPRCVRDGNSVSQPDEAGVEVNLVPAAGRTPRTGPEPPCIPADHNRREFALAIADFGIAYTAALEPVNPEPLGDSGHRDNSALRFGRRHVAATPARPLGISSEDPGSQYLNYRHEPLALRISEATPDPALGGFDYRQSDRSADGGRACAPGDADCRGDMANAFSSRVHAPRDRTLASTPQPVEVHAATREALRGTEHEARLAAVVASVEQWRRDFNCALYSRLILPNTGEGGACDPRIERREPWRLFGDPATPIFRAHDGEQAQIRLIQGAQEAQHIFTMNGVKWRRMPGSAGSGFINAQPIGISEHFEADIRATRFNAPLLDYLYFGSSVDQLWDGMWGIMRVTVPDHAPPTSPANARPAPGSRAAGGERQAAPVDDIAMRLVRPALAAADAAGPGTPGPLPPGPLVPGQAARVAPPPAADQATALAAVMRLPAALGRRGQPAAAAPARAAPTLAPSAEDGAVDWQRAVCRAQPGRPLVYRRFDVSAVLACDLRGDCGGAQSVGIEYSRRFGIQDDRAVVYVLNEERRCDGTSPERGCAIDRLPGNDKVLEGLRAEFAAGRSLEPLVLRAPAGACLEVLLRNHLPASPEDRASGTEGSPPRELEERRAYHNFLPMITDGFNVNQFRMSGTVGLSAPRVAQNPLSADGTNLGWNGLQLDRLRGLPERVWGQGSLVSPCRPGDAGCGIDETQGGMRRSFWSATDFDDTGLPVEFGALPLRSFGDPIKQPMHGLGGALVIGPEGSEVCADNRFAQRLGNGRVMPGGVSAEICRRDGTRYVDHVLMVQDAVNATRGGMPVPNLAGAEEPDDYGVKALNYRTEPLWARSGNEASIPFEERNEADYASVLSSGRIGATRCAAGIPLSARLPGQPCDPETPIFTARSGEAVRLHLVHPGGHTRQQGFAVSGHGWSAFPWTPSPRGPEAPPVFDAGYPSYRGGVTNGFGPMMGVTYGLLAGGRSGLAMDYLIRSQASFLFDGGLWGLLRVEPRPAAAPAGPRRR